MLVAILPVLIALGGCESSDNPTPSDLRIVSLAPNVTEILFALGLGDRLVGVTSVCDYPPAAKDIRVIGQFGAPNIEALVEVRPTLVIATDLSPTKAVRLRELGELAILKVKQNDFEGLFSSIIHIGRATGTQANAQRLVSQLRRRVEKVEEKHASLPEGQRPAVFVEISPKPIYTAGQRSFISEMLAKAGARNVADTLDEPFAKVTSEQVIRWNPDVIILGYMGPAAGAAETVSKRIGWDSIDAVRNHRIIDDIHPDLLLRPGPRIVDGLEALDRRLLQITGGAVEDDGGRERRMIAISEIRWARFLLAIFVGAGLSVAGVIFQAILRNPLAEPYILGVSSGAGLGAATAIVLGFAAVGAWALPGSAFVGATVTIFIVYGIAQKGGRVPVATLLLSGVIVGSVLGSILMFIISTSSRAELHNVMWWLLGDLEILNWSLLEVVATITSVGIILAFLFARSLNVMSLGEEPASHLGLRVEWTKKGFFLLASLMTAAAVSACGLIGFVGLIVPHCVRLLVGPNHRRLVLVSAVVGAVFLVLADMLARNVIAPRVVPIGVITAMAGGPFFIILLRRRKRAYWV